LSGLSCDEALEAEGFGGGGVVLSAFGDVEVAGVADGVDDGVAEGGEVDRSVAGSVGGVVFGEGDVSDVVAGFDAPVVAGQAGQVGAGGVGGGQAGGGVDGFAGGLAGAGVLPLAVTEFGGPTRTPLTGPTGVERSPARHHSR
jgi:hypothetical protein